LRQGLRGIRVLDFSTQIAGPYATKLLADAGAEVISVEPPGGDPLRRMSATGAELGREDSALFRFLHAGKKSVVGRSGGARIRALLEEADLVVEAFGLATDAGERLDVSSLRAERPERTLLSITPWGRKGPWADRPASEFTLQAESGSIGVRGLPGREPFQAGGRITEWVGGTFAAVAALAAVRASQQTGRGQHVDFSLLEVMHIASTNYADLLFRLMTGGAEDAELPPYPAQTVETPSIEPTRDGYVGFCTNTRQQFSDFLVLIDRPDLQEDEQLAQFAGRLMRFDEWNAIIHANTRQRTTAELIEMASLLRIPVAPICNGETVTQHEQLVARNVFVPDATGRFVQPRRPFRIDDEDPPPPRPAPALGDSGGSTDEARFESSRERAPAGSQGTASESSEQARAASRLPLEGLRILDMTAWWAGPSATHMLACLGAEVIHVESTTRPDGMRMVGGMLAAQHPDWWEASPFFLAANSNKKAITLDLASARGRELVEGLVARCDAVVENFTPRVLEGFGLTWERIHELNPQAIFVRMPAFGLSGPWRDNTGFAQTMEQLSGLAWLTGHPDDQPRIQRGPCDPLAGMHAALALLVALAERDASGVGHLVECTMVEAALNVAAEQILEFSAYGRRMEREGNRSPLAAPQGLYACAESLPGREQWLALSVSRDAQWKALRQALGDPEWAADPRFDTHGGRRAAHDELDEQLRARVAESERDELVERLLRAGVPAAPVADPRCFSDRNPQVKARGFFERPEHPIVGPLPIPGQPFRYQGVPSWIRSPAPTLGQHNSEVLGELLGLSAEAIAALERDGIIGTRPTGL
jgi:crotonobetainyl-CoA:carnitine CoA-transferase CaiB-like acyl-CoA transferase